MTERTFIDKNGNSWAWEETSETIEALKNLEEASKFAGNYKGPLYAPHPSIKNGKQSN